MCLTSPTFCFYKVPIWKMNPSQKKKKSKLWRLPKIEVPWKDGIPRPLAQLYRWKRKDFGKHMGKTPLGNALGSLPSCMFPRFQMLLYTMSSFVLRTPLGNALRSLPSCMFPMFQMFLYTMSSFVLCGACYEMLLCSPFVMRLNNPINAFCSFCWITICTKLITVFSTHTWVHCFIEYFHSFLNVTSF
jgi:hypothetical protein